MKLNRYLLFLFCAPICALASEHAETLHVPTKTLFTHGVNLFVFMAVFLWALLKKAELPSKVVEKRKNVEAEIQEIKTLLEKAEKEQKQYQEKMNGVDQETSRLLKNAEVKAKETVEGLKKEADLLVKKMVSDAEITASQEFKRIKEKVTQDIVEEAITQASQAIQKELEAKKQDQYIQKQLTGLN